MTNINSGEAKLIALAERLLRLTERRKISWTQATDDAYQYSASSSTVIIGNVDHDGRHPYFFDLYDAQGTVVDTFRTHFHSSATTDAEPSTNLTIEALYVMARRSALNVDSVLDSLLADLPEDE